MRKRKCIGVLSAMVLCCPIRGSAKCGGVNYSWGADALSTMHDYVVTMMLYVLYLLYAIAAIAAIIGVSGYFRLVRLWGQYNNQSIS